MKDYSKYFRLKDAYDFLIGEGCEEQVDCIESVGYDTYTKRLMVVGLIYKKNLVSKFLAVIWIQVTPTTSTNHHKDFMHTYNRRYGKRPELHICF